MDNSRKDTLKIQALTQRISQLVANYEAQLVDLRAEATLTIEELNLAIEGLRARISELESQNEPLEEEED